MTGLIVASILSATMLIGGILLLINDDMSFIGISLSVVGGLATFCFIIVLCFYGFNWKSSQYKANIINREYGTNYTKEEVFYSEDVIETIQQIKRTRIDIQGLGENK